MCSNIELDVDDFSDERRYKNREVRSSLVSQNSGLTKRENDSEGTPANLSPKISSSSLRSTLSKGEVLEFEKAGPMTNDQILDFIEKEVALLKSVSRKKVDVEWQSFSPVRNERCTPSPGDEDRSGPLLPFEQSPKSKEKCDISASEEHLTAHQHVMLEVAASCAMNEAESPVTITGGSGVTLPEKTEKYPALISSCSSSQGECTRETPEALFLLSKHVRWDREDGLKPVQRVGLHSVHSVIDGNPDANASTQKSVEDQQYCHVESKDAAGLFCLDSLTEKIEINNMQSVTMTQIDSVCSQTSSKILEDAAAGVCLQADLSISLAVNKVGKLVPPCRSEDEDVFFVAVSNDPQYEAISDDEDLPRLDMNLLDRKQEEERFADPSKDPQYEPISDAEDSPRPDINLLDTKQEEERFADPSNGDPQYETISDAEDSPRPDMNLLDTKQEDERFADPSNGDPQYETISEAEDSPRPDMNLLDTKEEERFADPSNDPQYETISEAEDSPRPDMNLLDRKQEEERFADPTNEDTSEDENSQFRSIAEEMPSLPCEVPDANAMQHEPAQSQAKLNPSLNEKLIPKEQMSPMTLDLAQHCSCSCFVETEDGFEFVLCPKCDGEKHLKWQTSHFFRPPSVTQHQEESEEAADEDNEWLVIHINVKDVKWEPADEEQAFFEGPKSVPNQVSAAAFSPLEVFDTPSQQAKAMQSRETTLQFFSVSSSWGIAETKGHGPQNKESHSDTEDSCETEDSCDYSSDSECNYLTVSSQFLKNLPLPASPEMVDSDSEKENEDHKMPNVQQCQTKGRSKSSGKDDIINLDSDTEEEDVQNCAETKTNFILFYTHTHNSGTACLSPLKKHSPETVDGQCGTVKETLQTSRLQSSESPAAQCQSRCYDQVVQTRNAQLAQRTEKCGHLPENKIGSPLKKASPPQNVSDDPSVIVIFDSDDEGKQSSKQVKRKHVSEVMSGGNTLCGEQRRDSEKKESAKLNNREPSVPSADSSKSQHESRLQHIKKRKLIKVRVHPERAHQRSSRPITSKTVERDEAPPNLMKNKTNVVLSEPEDNDDALVVAQKGLCTSKKPQIGLSSKNSSKMLPQSVGRDVDSTKAHHEHFPQKAKRQTASKTVERDPNKRKRKTRVLPSESEDSDDALMYAQISPPSMDCPQEQPQSVDRVVDSMKVCHDHVQQKTSGHMTSKIKGRELEKDLIRHKRKTRVLPSETEDSDDTLIYAQTSVSSADMLEKRPQTLDNDDDSTVAPNPLIPRFFVHKFPQSGEHLKLLKHSTIQKRCKNKCQAAPETPAETSKQAVSSKEEARHVFKGIKEKAVSKPKSVRDAHHAAAHPSSMHSSSSSGEHLSSSKLHRSHSYSSSSALNRSCTATKGPASSASIQSSAKEQVFSDWQRSFVPTRRDRKVSLESNPRNRNDRDSPREARPGPSHHHKAPRRRHRSYESVPLMKKLKYEAIQMSKDRKRDTPLERFPVGEDYKWKNQADFMASKRPGKRVSSPPRPHH